MKWLADKVLGSAFQYWVPIFLIAVSLALLASPYAWLAPAPGTALLGLLWIARRNALSWLFYGFVILVPFGAYRGLKGDLSFLRLHWVFTGVLALIVVCRILVTRRIPNELKGAGFWGRLFFFYLINFFALLSSKVPAISTSFMILLAAGYMLVALGMIWVDRNGFEKVFPAVVVGSVFVGSLFAVAGSVFHVSWFVSETSGRVLGGAPDPNNMSLMIIFSLPFAAYFLVTAQRLWQRVGLLLLIAVNVAAVVATFSRGGALILFLSLGLLGWEFRRLISSRNLGLLLGVAGLAITTFMLLIPDSYQQRLGTIRAADDFSMRRRLSYITVARDLVLDRPFFGNGPDSYASLYAKSAVGRLFRRKSESGLREAHNTYIDVVTGSGILGLVAFLMVLSYAFQSFGRALRLYQQAGDAQMVLLARAYRLAFAMLLVYLFIFSDVYHKYLLLSLAMSQVAVYQASQKILEEESIDATR